MVGKKDTLCELAFKGIEDSWRKKKSAFVATQVTRRKAPAVTASGAVAVFYRRRARRRPFERLHGRPVPRQFVVTIQDQEYRLIQRFSCTHRIEIFASERNLVACRSQEQHIILEIDTSRGFDKPLCLDFGDCHFRIGEGMHLEVIEAEIFHCPHKPGNVTHHLFPPRKSRRMADGGIDGISQSRLFVRMVS
jgi:hypothetical protein